MQESKRCLKVLIHKHNRALACIVNFLHFYYVVAF